MNANALTCFSYRVLLPNNGNATVRVEQKVNGVYQCLTTQQTQTTSGIFELVFTPSNENIRISVSGTSGFALNNLSLDRDNVDTLVNRYLVSPSDYGEPHLSSVFTSYACSGYRYGFNTQEKVDEISGTGNHYTAPYWEYDPRIVHRWNLDPKPVPYISPYAINQGNPIWFSDPYGDTIRNSHSKRKELAFEDKIIAKNSLNIAQSNFDKYAGITKDDLKSLRKNDKESFGQYNKMKSKLDIAQRNFNISEKKYYDEVRFEGIVNELIEEFRASNPELFNEFNQFTPYGLNEINIDINVQKGPIEILDMNGMMTGQTTTERVSPRINAKNQFILVNITLQVINKDDVIQMKRMRDDLIHALGHIDKGQWNDEDYARGFEKNIKIIRVNKMGKTIVFVLSLLMGLLNNYVRASDDLEILQYRAILIVHADYTGFDLSESNALEIKQYYDTKILKTEGLNECIFIKVTPVNNTFSSIICGDCKFILVFDIRVGRFYRLFGFDINEFTEFYNTLISSQYIKYLDYEIGKVKRKKKIFSEVIIEGYNIKEAYHMYYNNLKNSYYDPSSQRRKFLKLVRTPCKRNIK